MMTVKEVSRLTGVSVRTLQYYDKIGLLRPAQYTPAGYRLYDDTALEKLQQILLFRELEFSLKDIREITDSPAFDRQKALTEQITLLTLKKERLENLIGLAREIQQKGEKIMDFSAFDNTKIAEYEKQAKASWGATPAWQEYEEKKKGQTPEKQQEITSQMMEIFAQFGQIRKEPPTCPKARALVKRLQDFITGHFYTCTDEILKGLGKLYAAGGEFTENIDRAGGAGTAEYVEQAIRGYCMR